MNKKTIMLVGAVVAVAQWGVLARLIGTQERILREGVAYRFRTAPVDPYDAFRGRYVALALEPQVALWPEGAEKPDRGESFYVVLGVDSNGAASVRGASLQRPESGDFLRVRLAYSPGPDQVQFRYLVDRFYLPEDEAPRAEALYREHSRRGRQDAQVVLRVRKGEAVAEDLLVEGRPIREWMEGEEVGE